ncbi:MAG: hypothetical protein A4E57_00389 [Syntrophorhabdaceae bacterium PtaU1.Bin034]|jgi:hypothetical protein|nr:MAG: hypothetical protein A4E57_00389 [Syntrophorhabdaceae bacterium PtaU1.Bin034]
MINKRPHEKGARTNRRGNNRPDDDESDCYFDLSGLSHYASLSIRCLRSYLSLPIDPLPSYRLSKKILVRKSEFDAWMNRRKRLASNVSQLVDDALRGLRSKL